ncbi:SPOR domain-containing protein [Alloalcanivorax mobilis]|uniref:SPOR domain-containing protein n=1 Tax=Alloalcanivorax mobilis TaxID=2019569 RepID=UPI000B5B11F2|nr:SPOR domain-containing protein [Alloalcanivorax mobilis]ASK33995.1 cell division protein [Alcanivorax sp. N3-2A]
MDVKSRQRLIGFLLLLLLAAILVPLVLRSPDEVRVALDMSIPEPPALEEPEVAPVISDDERQQTDQQISEQRQSVADAGDLAAADQGADRARQPSADATPEPQAEPAPQARPEPAAEAEPTADPDNPSPAFTVQVASFSDRANADALTARLKEAGYNAYARAVQQDGNTWQRVFVGPEIKRDRAEALRQRLADDKRFALQGLVRGFAP